MSDLYARRRDERERRPEQFRLAGTAACRVLYVGIGYSLFVVGLSMPSRMKLSLESWEAGLASVLGVLFHGALIVFLLVLAGGVSRGRRVGVALTTVGMFSFMQLIGISAVLAIGKLPKVPVAMVGMLAALVLWTVVTFIMLVMAWPSRRAPRE